MTGPRARRGLVVQCVLVAATMVLALAPKPDGLMLVAPLLATRPAATIRWLLPTGARIAAPGPYAGSFVVAGARAALLPAAVANGAVLLSARFPGCGPDSKDRR